MRRRSHSTVRRIGSIAGGAVLVGALAAVGARVAGRNRTGGVAGIARRHVPGTKRRRQPDDQRYTCRCGTSYRVAGTDRHRVYWPVDASIDAPVLGDRCTSCDAPLPGGRATATTPS